ncbi:MAG TPA: T9SS type A sorting domain-containing protein, partial [Chitinophagales bacterium]|nr:T9SS type A sorting domain-containing protein [Chitinophagales bacterium]
VINIPLREGAAIDGIIAVYPNPATNQLNVLISASASANTLMRVYDVTGKEMMSNGVSLQKGINTIELDISTLAKASYMLDISLNNKSFVEKFVKK